MAPVSTLMMTTTVQGAACATVNRRAQTVTDDTSSEHYTHVAEQVTCDECARDEKRAMVLGAVIGIMAGAGAVYLMVRAR